MKISLINLGCKVNQYEIDGMYEKLQKKYEVTENLEFADLYIVNTCAITREAEKKSRQMIAKITKINPDAQIIVCGCASENSPEQFMDKKNITTILGNAHKGKIEDYIGLKGCYVDELPTKYEDDLTVSAVRTRGYVKIQDGCNAYCSYCIIPFLRGRSRSRSLKSILQEARKLCKTCKEIVLTGINVSDFRIDNRRALGDLLYAMRDLPCRIRLSSMDESVITDEFLETVSSMPNFCPHFHISLQSGCDKVLREMNRHYTTADFFGKVEKIKKYFKNPCISTDVIVGFPTENDDDFERTLTFVKKMKFSDIHYFAFSLRPYTAVSMLEQLNGDVIRKRERLLEQIKRDSNLEFRKNNLGQELFVLVEKQNEDYSEGLSQNYIKCYVDNKYRENIMLKVLAKEIYKDGIKCDVIERVCKNKKRANRYDMVTGDKVDQSL